MRKVRKEIQLSDVEHARPVATTISELGMVVVAGLIVVTYVQQVARSISSGSGVIVVVFLLAVALALTLALPLGAAWGVHTGRLWASVLVVLVALWGGVLLFFFTDVLSIVSAAVGIVAAVAIWMPSARRFVAQATRDRRISSRV